MFVTEVRDEEYFERHWTSSSSSSLGSTTSIIGCFGLLNDFLLFMSVLDAVLRIIKGTGLEDKTSWTELIRLQSALHLRRYEMYNNLIALEFQPV